MNIAAKFGLTEQEFKLHGEDVCERYTIVNEPFDHIIILAMSGLDFAAAVLHYGEKLGYTQSSMMQTIDSGLLSDGYTCWMHKGELFVSVINMTNSTPNTLNADSFVNFIDTLSHEIQHALMLGFEHYGMDAHKEFEPHAYATGRLTRRIFELLARNNHFVCMAMPLRWYPAFSAFNVVPSRMMTSLSSLATSSALIDQAIAVNQHRVVLRADTWSASTYFTGATHDR